MNNLKKIRLKHNISNKSLTEQLEITRQSLWNYENKKIPLKIALKLSEILNENVFEILGTDVFVLTPTTEEEMEIVIKNIKGE